MDVQHNRFRKTQVLQEQFQTTLQLIKEQKESQERLVYHQSCKSNFPIHLPH
jgi:hypothetical protein